MKAAELPAADRRAIRRGAVEVKPRTGRKRPARRDRPAAVPYRCAKCGATFDDYPPAERHVDAEHHAARLEVVL